MKWLNGYRTRLAFAGLLAVIVVGSGNAKADFTFGEPTNLGPTVNSSDGDFDAGISADGLFLYFGSYRASGYGDVDIWVATRPTQNDPWDMPVNLGPTVNSPYLDSDPSLSTDGLSLFFRSHRPGGSGGGDLYVTTRATTDGPWCEPVNLGPIVNSVGDDSDPCISADGLHLYFSTYVVPRPGGLGRDDIWVTTRPSTSDSWGEPINLGPPVNTPYDDLQPCITADGLALFFDGYIRPGGEGGDDIWVTTRASTDDLWGEPVNLGAPINTAADDGDPQLSADGLSIFFNSNRPGGVGGMDLWQAPVIPIVDLNSDGVVDAQDMCIIADHWGTDNSLCDIGPMPWGDGIVDVKDLIVLAEHLFTYPGAVAYWKLDETEGNTAHDSIGDNDGTVNGEPAWQPEGGMVDGALLLDGTDDRIATEYVRDPSEGHLSVFAWVKDGAPGQVLVSQVLGVNWLMADASSGHLMTELKGSGRDARPLLSEVTITDGNWHRVGLVLDGTNRILYVDDVVAAADTQTGLSGSNGGLNIGCGKNLEPGSFWSGLVDDVLIYNRAVKP